MCLFGHKWSFEIWDDDNVCETNSVFFFLENGVLFWTWNIDVYWYGIFPWNQLRNCMMLQDVMISRKFKKKCNLWNAQLCVEEWKNYSHQNFFRQINSLVIYLVNALLSRNFCQKSVIVNSNNFHITVWNLRNFCITWEIFREINLLFSRKFLNISSNQLLSD